MDKTFKNEQLEVLVGLGLNKMQALLYLTSLKYGLLSVLELSKLTKINRQQIYTEAEKLVEAGFYDVTKKHGRKYIPANPSKLEQLGRKKIDETEAVLNRLTMIMPQLDIVSAPKNKVSIKYFEGFSKIKNAFKQELDAAKNAEVLSLAGSIDDVFKFFPEKYWDGWNNQFVKNRSKSRMLVHNSAAARETAKNDPKYKRETRWLNEFPLKVNIDIFNDTVLIVSFYDEMAVWLESRLIAGSYRIMFNTLWTQAKSFE